MSLLLWVVGEGWPLSIALRLVARLAAFQMGRVGGIEGVEVVSEFQKGL
jgi:hypothetical protein